MVQGSRTSAPLVRECVVRNYWRHGPYFIKGTLNGPKYLEFLQQHLPDLIDDVPLQVRAGMWFQHDDCPAHYAIISREVF